MSIERTVPPNTAKEFLEKYSIKVSATERGVMVIKKKDKTRASQRKGALSNWKVVIVLLYSNSHKITFNKQFFREGKHFPSVIVFYQSILSKMRNNISRKREKR